MRGLIPSQLFGRFAARWRDSAEDDSGYIALPPLMSAACREIERGLTGIDYLGPLRAPAQRYYMAPLDTSISLDEAGEQLPFVLRDQAGRDILNPLVGGGARKQTLATSVGYWLHYLRTGQDMDLTGDELRLETTKDVLVELVLRGADGEQLHALADSGFGYSQVLPILAKVLLARPSALVMIEQPELHLNPALQVRLANFLVRASASRRCQIVIETHSEHMVNMIRVMAAEDPKRGQIAKNCAVHFIDVTEGCRPDIRKLRILEDGAFSSWPRSFMGEASELASRLLHAQAGSSADGVGQL